ncbi:unnamed protein product, partial [Prorocentrum cordatum]
ARPSIWFAPPVAVQPLQVPPPGPLGEAAFGAPRLGPGAHPAGGRPHTPPHPPAPPAAAFAEAQAGTASARRSPVEGPRIGGDAGPDPAAAAAPASQALGPTRDLVDRVEGIISEMEREVVLSARLGASGAPGGRAASRGLGERGAPQDLGGGPAGIDQRQRACTGVPDELAKMRRAVWSGDSGALGAQAEPSDGGGPLRGGQLLEIRRIAENCQRSEQRAWTEQEAAQARADHIMLQLQSMEARYREAMSAAARDRLAAKELEDALERERRSAAEAVEAHGVAEENLGALEEHSSAVLADCRELQSLLGDERAECQGLRGQVARMTEMLRRLSGPDAGGASHGSPQGQAARTQQPRGDEACEAESGALSLKQDICQLDAVVSDVVQGLEGLLQARRDADAGPGRTRQELEQELAQAQDAGRRLGAELETERQLRADQVRGLEQQLELGGAASAGLRRELAEARAEAGCAAGLRGELAEARAEAGCAAELRRELDEARAEAGCAAELERKALAEAARCRGLEQEVLQARAEAARAAREADEVFLEAARARGLEQELLQAVPEGIGEDSCSDGSAPAPPDPPALPEEERRMLLDDIQRFGWKSKSWVSGFSMLHWAAAENNVDLCRQLMHLRADPLAQDDFGRSPLQCAREAGHSGVERYFLEELRSTSTGAASPSLRAVDEPQSGCRAASIELPVPREADLPPALEQIVQRIDQYGWQNVGWAKGFTALHMAAKEDCAGLCARFLAQGADPWARDDSGRTAFDYAREFGSAGALAQLYGAAPRNAPGPPRPSAAAGR